MNRKVMVIGATGKTGKHICAELEYKQISYTVFVREQSTSRMEGHSGQIKTGDVLNEDEVAKAFQGEAFTDVVIALGSKELKATAIRSQGTQHVISALKNTQSQAQLHVVSALGIGDSWNQLSWIGKLISKVLIKAAMEDHTEQENHVMNSSLPYHIIRPVSLKDGEATGQVHVQNEGKLPGSTIYRADVAKFLVDSLIKGETGVSGICN